MPLASMRCKLQCNGAIFFYTAILAYVQYINFDFCFAKYGMRITSCLPGSPLASCAPSPAAPFLAQISVNQRGS